MKVSLMKRILLFVAILNLLGCSNISPTVEKTQKNFEILNSEYNALLSKKFTKSELQQLYSRYLKFDKEITEVFKSETKESPLSEESKLQLKLLREQTLHRLNIIQDLED